MKMAKLKDVTRQPNGFYYLNPRIWQTTHPVMGTDRLPAISSEQ